MRSGRKIKLTGGVYMVTFLIGHKGSGKTKKLIARVHEAVEASNGNVVCIEKGDTLTYDVDHKARLVNIEDYGINGFDAFYGFIAGMCAGNYDITDILVDSTLKIGGKDMDELAKFIEKVNPLAQQANINFTFSVSADNDEIPASLNDIVTKL